MDPDCVDFGMGLQLAHHEDGLDRLSTPHLSQFVYVDRASAARVGVVFSEGSVSHSAYVLARTIHPVLFQYARVARLGSTCSPHANQRTRCHTGLQHADFFCGLWGVVVSGAFAFAHVDRRCSGIVRRFVIAME